MTTAQSTKRAITHLAAFGDTDIFPNLPEIKFLEEKVEQISAATETLTPGAYRPQSANEFLVPKTSKSFRIAHQLTAVDTMLYLASVLDNAACLDALRIAPSEETAFSYRFQEGDGPRLYMVGTSFHDWLIKLCEFGGDPAENDERIVIETDISDFYQRIYHHRLENILDMAENRRSSSFTKKIFKSIRANQSFGLPVGQAASRLLSELVLSDTDNYLINEGVAHTRYVDDFRIIVENQTVAHATLCKLAEHLMVTEGLSLNGEKTFFNNVESMQSQSDKRINDVFNSVEFKRFENYLKITYEDDPSQLDDEDDAADLFFFDSDDLVDRIIELDDYGGKESSTFKALLRGIRVLGGASPAKLLQIDKRWFYLMPREYCLSFAKMDRSDATAISNVKNHFISLLNELPYKDLTIFRYWILDLFVRGTIPFSWDDFRSYDFSRSSVEKRAEYFLRGRLGQSFFFRAGKTRFGELSDWEKPAFLLGASSLPQDEYAKWIVSVKDQIPGPFAGIYADWVIEKWGRLTEVLDYTPFRRI